MRRLWLGAAAVVGAACGAEPARLPLTVAIPGAAVGAITLVQVAALPDPEALPECAALTTPCLAQSGHAGEVESSVSAAFAQAAAEGAGQVLVLEDLTVGQKYRIVVEAISEGSPTQVEASGCAITDAIVEGENDEVEVLLQQRTDAVCDATL